MSTVLVTGAGGFVGQPLVQALVGRGVEVDALSSRSRPPMPGVRWHRVDLMDTVAVDELVREIAPTRLVHLAWHTEPRDMWSVPENRSWLECSRNLLRAFASAGGRRLVVLGSCAEYSWVDAREPLHELRSPVEPTTQYGLAKDALHRLARAQAEREGIELAWGRLFFAYGPHEQPKRLAAAVIGSLLRGETVATTSGEQVRDFMYVVDVADAVLALLDSAVVGAVNIATGTGVRVRDLVDEAARLIGRPELVQRGTLPDRPGEPQQLVADVGRLREEVGFRPRWGLSEGLAATVRWWDATLAAQAAERA